MGLLEGGRNSSCVPTRYPVDPFPFPQALSLGEAALPQPGLSGRATSPFSLE